MVVETAHSVVKRVNKVCARDMVTLKMWCAVRSLDFFSDDIQWTMAHISRKSLSKRRSSLPVSAATCIGLVLADDWRVWLLIWRWTVWTAVCDERAWLLGTAWIGRGTWCGTAVAGAGGVVVGGRGGED